MPKAEFRYTEGHHYAVSRQVSRLCRCSIDNRNGTVRVYWYYKDDTVYYEITVPEGVTAHLTLPSGYTETLGGFYHFAE